MNIPDTIYCDFFDTASKVIDECVLKEPLPVDAIRILILDSQMEALSKTIEEYNRDHISATVSTGEVQKALKALSSETDLSSEVKTKMDQMNETARLAFSRLCLLSECLQKRNLRDQLKLQASGSLKHDDLMDFIGLNHAALRLSQVQDHLRGKPHLFEVEEAAPPPIDPPARIERIQRLFFQVLGYDPDHGMSEIKRIFFAGESEFSSDKDLQEAFTEMVMATKEAVTSATIESTKSLFSDHEQGGFTRVVSVQHSEREIDQSTGEEKSTGAPLKQTIEEQTSRQQRHALKVASQTTALQQEILGELLSLSEDEREARLDRAKASSDNFVSNISSLPPGPERVLFLQSLDSSTQRELAIHKLWESMLAQNGGKPPKIEARRSNN